MTDPTHSNPAPAKAAGVPSTPVAPAGVPATVPDGEGALDAHGFDPHDFDWRPVPQRPRRDGWTPEVQQRFIQALAATGMVEHACRAVNMSVSSAYALRHARGGESFARAWSAVLGRAAERMLDVAFEHAIEGEEVPIFDQDGVRTGAKRRYNTRMAIFLLKAYFPERFRRAEHDTRAADEVAPAPVPVAEVVGSLAPVTPAEPHLLGDPEAMAIRMLGAREDGERLDALPPVGQPYRPERIPDNHPRVMARSRRNGARRRHNEDRLDALYGVNQPEPDDTPPAPYDPGDWRNYVDDASASPPLPTGGRRSRKR